MMEDAEKPAVSIHATLAGGDVREKLVELIVWIVSIHATLAGGDVVRIVKRG